jgi:hypothetical protein
MDRTAGVICAGGSTSRLRQGIENTGSLERRGVLLGKNQKRLPVGCRRPSWSSSCTAAQERFTPKEHGDHEGVGTQKRRQIKEANFFGFSLDDLFDLYI